MVQFDAAHPVLFVPWLRPDGTPHLALRLVLLLAMVEAIAPRAAASESLLLEELAFFRPGLVREILSHLEGLGCLTSSVQLVSQPRLFATTERPVRYWSLHADWMRRLCADPLVRQALDLPQEEMQRWRSERKWTHVRRHK